MFPTKFIRRLSLLVAFVVALGFGSTSLAARPHIDVLSVKGAINPVIAGYIQRGIDKAESEEAIAAVIQLDTPGGLDSSMRDIVQSIQNAQIPVIVYVAPAGARAASAGAFITMAAHVAAMAPNTAIGAAHPVAGAGQELGGTLEEKVVNDAVAYIKGIASLRQRNTDWAERAVRESISASETEALQLKVVDMVAPDLPTLLSQIDGKKVRLLTREVTLETRSAEIRQLPMGILERFLFAISDPNIAYILLSLAMTGLFLELSNPGAILPGIVGGISLFLALFALGMLPVNYAGLLLIILAFIFFLAEIFVTSHGMLTVGGVASLTVGSLILISSSAPFFAIDRRLIAGVVAGVTFFFVFVVSAVVRAHRRPPTTGREGLEGKVAVARTPLNPEGLVFVQGERWQAYAEGGPVEAGEEVIISKVDGMRLRVAKRK